MDWQRGATRGGERRPADGEARRACRSRPQFERLVDRLPAQERFQQLGQPAGVEALRAGEDLRDAPPPVREVVLELVVEAADLVDVRGDRVDRDGNDDLVLDVPELSMPERRSAAPGGRPDPLRVD